MAVCKTIITCWQVYDCSEELLQDVDSRALLLCALLKLLQLESIASSSMTVLQACQETIAHL